MSAKRLLCGLATLGIALGLGSGAAGQTEDPSGLERLRSFPPRIALGMRALALEQHATIRPSLVIVPDADRFVQLLSMWSVKDRWPILIDDGSDSARENIARFVRAFEPAEVLLWEGDPPSLPDKGGPKRAAIENALFASWGAEDRDSLDAVWAKAGFVPPGVVVTSENDGAWTAGLALASGRGMELMWAGGVARNPGSVIKKEDLAALDTSIRQYLSTGSRSWRTLGDDIDAIALCKSVGTRIKIEGKKGHHALTDRIGRFEDGRRYAWCSMVFGDEQESLYRAMCAMFLRPSDVWLFDGYEAGFAPPFALDSAADLVAGLSMRVTADLPPNGSAKQWQQRAVGGISEDLVLVNTKGHATWFDVSPGRLFGSDIPLLRHPAAVAFIHSFSAQRLNDPQSIASRWLDSGAYAYVGSVHEPYLGAFQPGEALLKRLLLSRIPWGAAARIDDGPVWKINVFGDPLMTWGIPLRRSDQPLELSASQPLESAMRALLEEGHYERALAYLVMLGRDDAVVRFVGAAQNDGQAGLTPALAGIGLLACFRQEDHSTFVDLYERIASPSPLERDLLWQSVRAERVASGDRSLDERTLGLLRASIRGESVSQDAGFIAPEMVRVYGRDAVRRMYDQLLAGTKDKAQINQLRAQAKRYER